MERWGLVVGTKKSLSPTFLRWIFWARFFAVRVNTYFGIVEHRRTPMADTSVTRDHLRALVERIERLEEEKKAIADDIKDVYGEAKANGFDVKTLRHVIRLRKVEAAERAEQEAMLDLYMTALGMVTVPMDFEGGGSLSSRSEGAAPAGQADRMDACSASCDMEIEIVPS